MIKESGVPIPEGPRDFHDVQTASDVLSSVHQGLSPLQRPVSVDHSPKSSAEVKNTWSYTLTPPNAFTTWFFIKCRDNFTIDIK
jgi:hypothetical protein